MNANCLEILGQTNELTRTAVVSDVMPLKCLELLQQGLLEAITGLAEKNPEQFGYRLYLNNEIQDKAFAHSQLRAYLPEKEENFESWISRIFEGQRFGLIFNQIEKFSNTIPSQISLFMREIFEITGIPQNGFHTSTFLGNYGYTPLGVHKDSPGSSVIHFHLGPAKKVMYTWDKDLYEDLCGPIQNNQNYLPLLEHANKFEFGAGDIFFMRPDEYHIGFTEATSVGLTFWFDNTPATTLVNKIFDLLSLKVSSLQTAYQKQTGQQAGATTHLTAIRGILGDKFRTQPLSDVIKDIAENERLRLLSNNGWRFRTRKRCDENDLIQISLNTIINGAAHGKILYSRASSDKIRIFARGHLFQWEFSEALIRLIKLLNTRQPQTYAHIASACNEEENNSIVALIQRLYSYYAIDLKY